MLQVGRERLLEGRALHLVLELLVGHRGGGVHVDADGRAGAVGQRDDLDARGAGHLRACKVGHPGWWVGPTLEEATLKALCRP